jgi:hypothetical protein
MTATATKMTIDLPKVLQGVAMPERIANLPRDERGYPTPRFVAWLIRDPDGKVREAEPGSPGAKPDFRVIAPGWITKAYSRDLCWVCGEPLDPFGKGAARYFCMGPMCVVNRVNSEPPSHFACAEYSVKSCPFLTRPRMRRLPTDDLGKTISAGIMIDRNPGCVALVKVAKGRYAPFRAGDGVLFRLAKIERVDWWAEGRRATRAEIMASIDSGLPILEKMAREDGEEGLWQLRKAHRIAMRYVPAA